MTEFLDVFCTFHPAELAKAKDPMQKVAEVCTAAARELAGQSGHHLRNPEPHEIISRDMVDPTTGDPILGVSTRWAVDR